LLGEIGVLAFGTAIARCGLAGDFSINSEISEFSRSLILAILFEGSLHSPTVDAGADKK